MIRFLVSSAARFFTELPRTLELDRSLPQVLRVQTPIPQSATGKRVADYSPRCSASDELRMEGRGAYRFEVGRRQSGLALASSEKAGSLRRGTAWTETPYGLSAPASLPYWALTWLRSRSSTAARASRSSLSFTSRST